MKTRILNELTQLDLILKFGSLSFNGKEYIFTPHNEFNERIMGLKINGSWCNSNLAALFSDIIETILAHE